MKRGSTRRGTAQAVRSLPLTRMWPSRFQAPEKSMTPSSHSPESSAGADHGECHPSAAPNDRGAANRVLAMFARRPLTAGLLPVPGPAPEGRRSACGLALAHVMRHVGVSISGMSKALSRAENDST